MTEREKILLEFIYTTLHQYQGKMVLVEWVNRIAYELLLLEVLQVGDAETETETVLLDRTYTTARRIIKLNPKGVLYLFRGALVREPHLVPLPPYDNALPTRGKEKALEGN